MSSLIGDLFSILGSAFSRSSTPKTELVVSEKPSRPATKPVVSEKPPGLVTKPCKLPATVANRRLLNLSSINYNLSYNDLRPDLDLSKFRSKGEKTCAQTLMTLFDIPFVSVRPSWLCNSETGRNLEIDCYNEDLMLGVEYNGEQHYKPTKFGDSTQVAQQKKRDRLKRDLCCVQGVLLIVVPYTVKLQDIPCYIVERIPAQFRRRSILVTGRAR